MPAKESSGSDRLVATDQELISHRQKPIRNRKRKAIVPVEARQALSVKDCKSRVGHGLGDPIIVKAHSS